MGLTVMIFGFPSRVPADSVKQLVERYTGQGTVVALKVEASKSGPRAYAVVQFLDARSAEMIVHAQNSLYYGSSYLKVRYSDKELVRNPATNLQLIDQVTLHFGCQISGNKFSVLWSCSDVTVKFGTQLKTISFILFDGLYNYMLQLSYKSIWKTVLYNPSSGRRKLLIQLFGAPRISKKVEGSPYSYYNVYTEDQWVRTTDFTRAALIGQSSGLCLEFPHGSRLPRFRDDFVYFKEKEEEFHLQEGYSFSQNSVLAPIVGPPRGLSLPYNIVFKICSLVQMGCIPGPELDANFYRMVNPQLVDIRYIEHALEKIFYLKECCYDPVKWLESQYRRYQTSKPSSPTISLEGGLVYVRRVQITPSRVYFTGPEINVSNRVLRQYKDRIDDFLRVSFVDEDWDKLFSLTLSSKTEIGKTRIYERILSVLREGIRIGDKRFDFLAFSSSQLRENSLWMFAPSNGVTADDIRKWMGDFRSIRNVAKYAARLGQSFGSSTETLTVQRDEYLLIPDITRQTGDKTYTFSDGIGKISADFARRVAAKCRFTHRVPSAFQIRYGGFKGVVAVDPSSNMKLSLRPSMKKYESDNTKLDVLSWSKYLPCFLNRQIITLLSTLGVEDRVFLKKQREAVAQLDEILVDPLRAQEVLDLMAPGENSHILKEMLKCGYKPDEEPFLSMMLRAFRSSKLLDLRTKSRIFVPEARQLMGCLDETGTLEYGEVFVQISGSRQRQFFFDGPAVGTVNDYNSVVSGTVFVAKNPCLHPGDIRVVKAVDVPILHHMVDCLVFPQKGHRPLPDECSGSDLDGDIYFVCWDTDLFPLQQDPPMDYDPAPTTRLDHDVTMQEVQKYFTDYIVNDTLGVIANAHTAFADRERAKARSPPCLELAKLFSVAVDFPKTGVPANIPYNLRVKEFPDFMEKSDRVSYQSENVLGKLYREVRDIEPLSITAFTRDVAERSYDPDLEIPGYEDYVEEAHSYKDEYDYKLGNLMDYYGVKTEAEMLTGGILKMSKTFDRRKDAEAVADAVRALRNEARSWFRAEDDDAYAKASAWYHVTYHPDYWGCYNEGLRRDHFISFPWCVHDKLIKIKRDSVRSQGLASRFRRF
ncbi:hypothetical protein M569_04468, partial [Genlisea aurea]